MAKRRLIFYGLKYFPSRGGTSRVVENLALQFKDEFEVILYCYKDKKAQSHIEGLTIVEINPLFKGAFGAFFYFFYSSIHILCKQKNAIIHAHSTDCSLFLPLLRIKFKIVATSHEAPYKRDKWNWFIKLYFKVVERIFLFVPNICTCISLPLSDYYNLKYSSNVQFIPNGINVTSVNNYDTNALEKFIPIKANLNSPFILFSARRIMSTKGCHTLLDALKQLNYKGQIFIAGELNKTKYLEDLQKSYLELNIFFLGFVHPLPALLALVNKCKYFVFPSETEGMSIMLLEVASVGKPIIASNIPENVQIFNSEEVLYFESKSVVDLKEKIIYAEQNFAEMVRLGNNCREKVERDYQWSKISNSYKELYFTLLKD